MGKYQFQVTLTVYGYIEAETDDPETYAQELEEMGITAGDLTFIRDDEIEIDDWDEVKL